uniref:Ig-like domain-containing protein n=1 Tax=Anguilla anguilla TaxID=7936 RepID=A0A0E9WRL0_ANGAN
MLWYQQAKGKQSLELVGFLVHAEVTQDEKYKGKFNLTGNGNKRGSLLISQLSAEDSGTYFCAASKHSGARGLEPLRKPSNFITAK